MIICDVATWPYQLLGTAFIIGALIVIGFAVFGVLRIIKKNKNTIKAVEMDKVMGSKKDVEDDN